LTLVAGLTSPLLNNLARSAALTQHCDRANVATLYAVGPGNVAASVPYNFFGFQIARHTLLARHDLIRRTALVVTGDLLWIAALFICDHHFTVVAVGAFSILDDLALSAAITGLCDRVGGATIISVDHITTAAHFFDHLFIPIAAVA
jgi:hypothetical protein